MLHLECFCCICNGIEIGEMGTRLRDMMRDGGVTANAIDYLRRHSPQVTTYLNSDFALWKEFISRNSLPYVLRILTGLCRSHQSIQDQIGESCIPLLHKLEQFSSGNLVSVLAEDLLAALKQNPSSKVSAAIEHVRNQTKLEKKKLAIAMRQKQLNQLGMPTRRASWSPPIRTRCATWRARSRRRRATCAAYAARATSIIRKRCSPSTRTARRPSSSRCSRPSRARASATPPSLTSTSCTSTATRTPSVRRARAATSGRTPCCRTPTPYSKFNGILPIWGPHVSETLFSNALARHNSYLLEATGIRDSSYMLCVHDLKLLLWRFADNASFSEESGGGGRESNINLIPYMIHIILYSINT